MNLTIRYSGPGLLIDSFEKYCRASGILSPSEKRKFFFNGPLLDHFDVLGTTAISHSDQTWIEKKSAVAPQRFFYDDSSIKYSDPHQAITQKKKR